MFPTDASRFLRKNWKTVALIVTLVATPTLMTQGAATNSAQGTVFPELTAALRDCDAMGAVKTTLRAQHLTVSRTTTPQDPQNGVINLREKTLYSFDPHPLDLVYFTTLYEKVSQNPILSSILLGQTKKYAELPSETEFTHAFMDVEWQINNKLSQTLTRCRSIWASRYSLQEIPVASSKAEYARSPKGASSQQQAKSYYQEAVQNIFESTVRDVVKKINEDARQMQTVSITQPRPGRDPYQDAL